MAKNKNTRSNNGNGANVQQKKDPSHGKQKRKNINGKSEQADKSSNSLIDDNAKKDILGIVLIIVGVIIFAISLIKIDAPVTQLITTVFKYIFGLGIFVLPFILIGLGISFFFHMEKQKVTLRVTIGFSLIFVAILVIMATCAPCVANNHPEQLFETDTVINYGGIIGSSISWVGVTLFGSVVTLILMTGMIGAGLVVIGLSVSKIVKRLKERRNDIDNLRAQQRTMQQNQNMPGRVPAGNEYNAAPGQTSMFPSNALYDSSGQVVYDKNGQAMTNGAPVYDNPEVMQQNNFQTREQALDANRGKKRGLKTRILGFAGQEKPSQNPEDYFGYDSNQSHTRRLSDALPEIDESASADAFSPVSLQDLPSSDYTQNLNNLEDYGSESEETPTILLGDLPNPEEETTTKRTTILGNRKDRKSSVNTADTDEDLDESNDKGSESSESNSANKKSATSSRPKKNLARAASGFSSSAATPTPTEDFDLPDFNMLEKSDSSKNVSQSNSQLKATAENLQKTLGDFGISAKVVGWVPGPTVTLFKVDLPAGVRVSRITALNDDIALALAAPGVRVFAPIPGTTYVGIEVPNAQRQTVLLSDVLSQAGPGPMQIAIGKDVEGNAIVSDLAKMPHLLIGGTTGSGKSVSINAMIMSILMRATPDEVRMILIDPKRVEFMPYNGIPHLYVPVVTEPKEAASALSWGVAEMERRLKLFSSVGVRNIGNYNAKAKEGLEDSKGNELHELPYIVIVIDELADLMMAIGKEVEYSISRIAQLARAAGIHLIVATQRPSTNVVTGLIKANITNRIAFNVASGIDSRVILDTGGAESLIGLGDLLLSKPELSKPLRIQGCYVSESEIFQVVEHLKEQAEPEYHKDILKTNLITVSNQGESGGGAGGAGDDDSLFWEAAKIVVNAQQGSTSSLQRRFKIGYARAGRIMDMLEEKGIVGPQNGSKPREVLVDSVELEGIKALEDYDVD